LCPVVRCEGVGHKSPALIGGFGGVLITYTYA
jgi:hypothetical protein